MFTSRRANESAEEEERIGMNEAEGKHQHTQTCAHTRNLKSWTIRQTTTTTTITLKIIKAIVKELEPNNNNNKIVKQFQAYFVLVSAERVYLCTATFLPVPFFLNDLPFACTFFHSDSVGRRIKKSSIHSIWGRKLELPNRKTRFRPTAIILICAILYTQTHTQTSMWNRIGSFLIKPGEKRIIKISNNEVDTS